MSWQKQYLSPAKFCLMKCSYIRIPVLTVVFCYLCTPARAQQTASVQNQSFWQVDNLYSISWNLAGETRLPHADHTEMNGQRVSGIIRYEVDRQKRLRIIREIFFPQLRTFSKTTDPDWMQYRAYLKEEYGDDLLPVITCQNQKLDWGTVNNVRIGGSLVFELSGSKGLTLQRSFFPSMTERLFVEKWRITNASDTARTINIGSATVNIQEQGQLGQYFRTVSADAASEVTLAPGKAYEFGLYISARLNNEPLVAQDYRAAERQRNAFLDTMKNNLVWQTPDSVINTLFYFSKIRAAESIFETSMGLVHSPGGGRYYTGIWANDQAEYSGPFFPYLGYAKGTIAAMNTYRKFLQHIPKDGGKIWASFEMDGQLPCCSKDRGDAAMILFGATHFLLASGNAAYAQELWPLLQWCVTYSESRKNEAGVIASESDELEGRFPTGTANLSTSSLYYGGLVQLSALVKAMGKPKEQTQDYQSKAVQLKAAIERYFGAQVEGETAYKYYQENTTLRSWICLPLVVGITNRKEGTLNALFNKLWSDNGVLIESQSDPDKPKVFWDRGTLYAFRGAFKAGAADKALARLQPFSRNRLLGFHVPYMVEAWPEGGMAHLSAESALYCRIFTEGVLGFTPTGFQSFRLQPRLPQQWKQLSLTHMKAFNDDISIHVRRAAKGLQLTVRNKNKELLNRNIKEGQEVDVQW
jgi:hypothetical protein